MISRRHAFAVTIVGLIGGSSEALARTKKESSPVTRFDTDHDGPAARCGDRNDLSLTGLALLPNDTHGSVEHDSI